MPVTVDLPLVPATPIRLADALNSDASSSARVIRCAPTASAATMSGTVASTAAEATTIWSADTIPLPSWRWSAMPRAARSSNFAGNRPESRLRSDPATVAPRPARIIASGIMPEPPIPTKKKDLPVSMRARYRREAAEASERPLPLSFRAQSRNAWSGKRFSTSLEANGWWEFGAEWQSGSA